MEDATMMLDRGGSVLTDCPGDASETGAATVPVCAGVFPLEDLPAEERQGDEVTSGRGERLSVVRSLAERAEPEAEQIVEALLFAADTPLSLNRLAELAGCSPVQVRLHVASLNDKYVLSGLSFRIEAIARGYQMMTMPRFQPWLAKLNEQRSQTRLSPAALETLAIVAYKQPVIRADIEAIRGVACGEVLNRLRELGLVNIRGRAEVVGRPLLYGTTRKFLDLFGLADLDDLPPMEALALRRASPSAEVTPVSGSAGTSLAVSA